MRLVPKRSAAHPVTGITADSASVYPVTTHWIVVSEASKSIARRAIATLMTVVSRIDMIAPSTTTPAIFSTVASSLSEVGLAAASAGRSVGASAGSFEGVTVEGTAQV
jgi:hypothetical protein